MSLKTKLKPVLKVAGVFFVFVLLLLPLLPVSATGSASADSVCPSGWTQLGSGDQTSCAPNDAQSCPSGTAFYGLPGGQGACRPTGNIKCPSGWTQTGSGSSASCHPSSAKDCPSGTTMYGLAGSGVCRPNGTVKCPSGWTQLGIGSSASCAPNNSKSCPSGTTMYGLAGSGVCRPNKKAQCPTGFTLGSDSGGYLCKPNLSYLCPNGYKLGSDSGGNVCQPSLTYSCPSGFNLTSDSGGAACQPTPTSVATGGSGGTGTGADTKTLTCDTEFTNPLTWVICPVVDALVKIIDLVDGMITNALTINTATIFCKQGNSTCSAYYSAWSSFRDIALGLMAIAGLIIVTSQALGMEILDAYTIRKALPRLLVAAVMITLSWPLMELFVSITNDLGFGIRHLIYAPFASIKDNIDLNFTGGITNLLFGGAATGAAGVAAVPIWIAAGGAGVLLSYAATGALAVLIAIIVLTLRQVAIILLIILAPVAIVCYILPNTERVYKFWWESFSKALLMFPIIAGFIATGRVFSAVALHSGGLLNGFIGFGAYFAPYFLIPATFKLAGGALRQIGGFVNDRTRGGFDRLKNYRANVMKNRVARARNRGLYKADETSTGLRRLGHWANQIGFYTLEADHRIPYDLGTGTGLLGRAGRNPVSRALFGGMAQEMAVAKGRQAAEHAEKARRDTQMHYSGAYAVKGMREKFADDLDADTLSRLDEKFGTHQVWDSSAGKMVTRWNTDKMPGNDDTHGWIGLGQELQNGARAGSDAHKAGVELQSEAGKLTRLGLDPETQRANIRNVSDAILSAEGKISPDDLARDYSEGLEAYRQSGDPAVLAIATSLFHHNEQLAGQNRHAMRSGKGVRTAKLKDGREIAYSTLADKVQVGERIVGQDASGKDIVVPEFMTKDGGVTINSTDPQIFVPAATKEAKDNLMTLRHGSAEMSKGEIYEDIAPAVKIHGTEGRHVEEVEVEQPVSKVINPVTGKPFTRKVKKQVVRYSPAAQEIRKNLIIQRGTWAQTDPGGREKLDRLLQEIGVTDEEAVTIMQEYHQGEEAHLQGEPPAGGEPQGGEPGGGEPH